MNFKKRVNGSWTDIPHYIHTTSTDTFTTLPADLYADGNNATVGLVGNMSQSGTPTPQNPIQPQSCGDLETNGEKAGQYKIPISSGNTTTPVYLGEVESTRKIKKLVLTGEEAINGDVQYNRFIFTIQDMRSEGVRLTKLFCTHYQNISDGRPIANVPNNSIYTGGGTDSQKVFINTTDYTTVTGFKSYLAAQYANGTPVTVWYVLAEPETAVVNEPLMRIGDYADTLSNISIPVTAGGDTLSVGTTVQPSEVTATYKVWHPVADVHERENGQWD